ncbi:36599_t:CDS:2, partial [Racocetra persica]
RKKKYKLTNITNNRRNTQSTVYWKQHAEISLEYFHSSTSLEACPQASDAGHNGHTPHQTSNAGRNGHTPVGMRATDNIK